MKQPNLFIALLFAFTLVLGACSKEDSKTSEETLSIDDFVGTYSGQLTETYKSPGEDDLVLSNNPNITFSKESATTIKFSTLEGTFSSNKVIFAEQFAYRGSFEYSVSGEASLNGDDLTIELVWERTGETIESVYKHTKDSN